MDLPDTGWFKVELFQSAPQAHGAAALRSLTSDRPYVGPTVTWICLRSDHEQVSAAWEERNAQPRYFHSGSSH